MGEPGQAKSANERQLDGVIAEYLRRVDGGEQVDGTHYIAMEYIDGKPLSNYVSPERPMDERKAALVIRKLAQALSHAHQRGIIHRDLKPSNVMIGPRHEPIVTDFGLARQVNNRQSIRMTQSGMLPGTPAYMPTAERLLELKPGHRLAFAIYKKLTTGGAIGTSVRGPRRRSSTRRKSATIPEYVRWIAIAGATALVVFGLTYWGMKRHSGVLSEPDQPIVAKISDAKPGNANHANPASVTVGEKSALDTTDDRQKAADQATGKPAAGATDLAAKGNAAAASPGLLVAPFDETAARKARSAWAAHLNAPEEVTNSIGMKLVLIPPGEFEMGSPASEQDRSDNEQQHPVKITKPIYLGVYEVTQSEYQRVIGTNPSDFASSGNGKDRVTGQETSRFPVESVSWNDAAAFCKKLSEMEDKTYRLPTEAEWEFACRAGTTTPFHFGSQLNGEQANVNGNFPYGTIKTRPSLRRTTTVGSYAPNEFGLCDMHGNVWEWCADYSDEKYYGNSPDTDPQGPSVGSLRVLRGGSWLDDARNTRSSYRSGLTPVSRYYSFGFRVARTP
ncbi:MAG: SUMF1/EgtB/PvdO family nonheme iron enzyme [Planctomycetaceae bacterium]